MIVKHFIPACTEIWLIHAGSIASSALKVGIIMRVTVKYAGCHRLLTSRAWQNQYFEDNGKSLISHVCSLILNQHALINQPLDSIRRCDLTCTFIFRYLDWYRLVHISNCTWCVVHMQAGIMMMHHKHWVFLDLDCHLRRPLSCDRIFDKPQLSTIIQYMSPASCRGYKSLHNRWIDIHVNVESIVCRCCSWGDAASGRIEDVP